MSRLEHFTGGGWGEQGGDKAREAEVVWIHAEEGEWIMEVLKEHS